MAITNSVKENDEPGLIIESGDNTYLCYPDFGVPTDSSGWAMPKWAVKVINTATVGGKTYTTPMWAGGSKEKVHKIDDVETLNFQYLV